MDAFEKIKVSLWDIFTFFLSGFVLFLLIISLCHHYGYISFFVVIQFLKDASAGFYLLLVPFGFTAIGMLLEPFSNYFDRYLLGPMYNVFHKSRRGSSKDDEEIVKVIKENYLGLLSGKINNPYHLCKEYVEAKQLSSTFMVYLSRFGFYRNAALLSFVLFIVSSFDTYNCFSGISISLMFLSFSAMYIFKRRSAEFYSYQAPAIYSAFLIDKMKWVRET